MQYQWCKYNHIYNSEKHGNILFNAMTNKLAIVENEFLETLDILKKQPDKADTILDKNVINTLRKMKILVTEGEEDFYFLRRKHWRCKSRYGSGKNSLGLTIAPTMACNFACTYCFEGEKENHVMSDETAEKLISFVKDYPDAKRLSVSWFGGEPLMAFGRICKLTGKFKNLFPEDKAYVAHIITNGYFLTPEKADQLDDLHIRSIQLTIDGPEENHNQRRMLLNGGKTFSTIIDNMDYLLKVWKGSLIIRCNIYAGEMHLLKELNRYFQKRFKNHKNIPQAYPGFIHDLNDKYSETRCANITSDDIAAMLLEVERKDISRHISMLYPNCRVSGCTSTGDNGYVIGPKGEVYKCWDDLGEKERVVGSLYDEKNDWNEKKLSIQYRLGSNSFDDPVCQKCFYVHICDGGCSKTRQLRKYENKDVPPACCPMKGHINEVLDYICDNIRFGDEIDTMLFEPEEQGSIKAPVKCLN